MAKVIFLNNSALVTYNPPVASLCLEDKVQTHSLTSVILISLILHCTPQLPPGSSLLDYFQLLDHALCCFLCSDHSYPFLWLTASQLSSSSSLKVSFTQFGAL